MDAPHDPKHIGREALPSGLQSTEVPSAGCMMEVPVDKDGDLRCGNAERH